jgi:trigger factor
LTFQAKVSLVEQEGQTRDKVQVQIKMAKLTAHALLLCGLVPLVQSFAPNIRSTSFITQGRELIQSPVCIPAAEASRLQKSSLNMLSDSPKSTMKRLPGSAVELSITATAEQTKNAYDQVIKELAKTLEIPGFRKGSKVPANVIENVMLPKGGKKTIYGEALKILLAELVDTAIKEDHQLEAIGQPVLDGKVEDLADSFTPGETIEMVVKCDVWPDVKFKDVEGQEKPYFGLKGSYKRKPFNQERFDAALKDLMDRHAVLSPMEEDKSMAWGDACSVNMEGFMANDDGSKGEPLPNAASGENVEVILTTGRYMEGLAEGLVGAKVGDTKEITVSFPERLKDKSLAGKKALFDVTVSETSYRKMPELDDEFAEMVRPGLTYEALEKELKKAIDDDESKEFIDERNKALAIGLSERMDMEIPDTVVTSQAREKYAVMMADMRSNGMADEEIQKLITPENFQKYKKIVAKDIQIDFLVSLGVEEIAIRENIEVPAYDVDEQIGALRKQAAEAGEENFDEKMIRAKVEPTLQRSMVMDFLAQNADLEVQYIDENFDAGLMEQLAKESLDREEADAKVIATTAETEA